MPSHPIPVQLPIDADRPDPLAIGQAVTRLVAGELVAYPTDTVYGLAADPRRPDAVKRLFEVKGRPPHLAIPLIAADFAQVRQVGAPTTLARRLAEEFWPGPLTVIMDARRGLDPQLLGGGSSVAVRVPALTVARDLARELGHPITATSANRSGAPPARSAPDVIRMLGSSIVLVLDVGVPLDGASSTIVDARDRVPKLVRAGRVPWDRVLQSLT